MSFFYRCTLNWRNTQEGTNAQNVLHFEDPSDTKSEATIGAIIDNEWWGIDPGDNHLRQYTCDAVVLQSITIQRVWPLPALGSVFYITAQRPGHQGGPVKHPGLGFLFTLRDGGAGRAHRGRVYHYGAVGGHLFNAGPNPALLFPNAFPTLIDHWLNNFGPLPVMGIHWCIFHRNVQDAGRFTRVVNVSVSPIVAFQRRRRVGIGF